MLFTKVMDARIKSGHDESGSGDAFEEPWEEMDDRQSSVEPHHGPVKFFGLVRKQHEE
jgi:hypothetical protein